MAEILINAKKFKRIIRQIHDVLHVSLKDDVLPETLTPPKIVLPEKKLSLTLDPLKQMVIITP